MQNKINDMFSVFEELVDSDKTDQLIECLSVPNLELILCGVGKNWYICQKLEKTFLSLGFNARALDPVHGLHGDVGIIKNQVILFISKSGETKELKDIIKYLHFLRDTLFLINPTLIGIFLKENPSIKDFLDFMITTNKKIYEFDENNIIPSLSINLIQMYLDYVAIKVFENFPDKVSRFKYNHPAGKIGEILKSGEFLNE